MKSFDAYMAESGQQSTLDNLRQSFQYDAAKAQYEKTGSYGGSTGSSPSGGSPRVDYVEGVTNNLLQQDQANQAKVNDARQALIDYYAGLEDPTTRYMNLREQYGVTEQEDLVNAITRQVLSTEDILRNVEPSVNQRSGDFFVTDADRQAIIARESQPHQKTLVDLLRSKEREEVGLAGKQSLVGELLQLSLQGDEMRAKPLQLGVDYSQDDRQVAINLLSSMAGLKINAFSADQSAAESAAEAEKSRAFQLQQDETSYQNQLNMEDIQQANRIELEKLQKSLSDSGKNDVTELKTEDAWNTILSRAKTEYDVWNQINNNQDVLRAAGVDVDELWRKHKALAADTGQGGAFRKDEEESGGYY